SDGPALSVTSWVTFEYPAWAYLAAPASRTWETAAQTAPCVSQVVSGPTGVLTLWPSRTSTRCRKRPGLTGTLHPLSLGVGHEGFWRDERLVPGAAPLVGGVDAFGALVGPVESVEQFLRGRVVGAVRVVRLPRHRPGLRR